MPQEQSEKKVVMTTTKKTVLWIVAVIAVAYGWFHLSFPRAQFNYKLTLEAVTPDGPKTGSTVVSLDFGSIFVLDGRKGVQDIVAEALYLDLGQGKNLFVTLNSKRSGREGRGIGLDGSKGVVWLPFAVFDLRYEPGEEREITRQVLAAKAAGPKDVPFLVLPTTVTFADLTDPTTMTLVDPRDLAASFGPGYALKSATMEITDEPPSREIEKILPWLKDYKAPPFGARTDDPLYRVMLPNALQIREGED